MRNILTLRRSPEATRRRAGVLYPNVGESASDSRSVRSSRAELGANLGYPCERALESVGELPPGVHPPLGQRIILAAVE
jgi:hypothetical protein